MKTTTESGYIWEPPPWIDIPGRPELRFFPQRIILFDRADLSSSQRNIIRQAIYVPDLATFRPRPEWDPEGIPGALELYEMWYVSVTDLNGEMRFEASLLGDWKTADKYFKCQRVEGVDGDESWDTFFRRVAGLPIHAEERTMAIDLDAPVIDSRNGEPGTGPLPS
jgi:hypothetical protein